MRKILILSIILLASCSLNKIVQHHGVHNLEKKQEKLKINETNKNDIIRIIGPLQHKTLLIMMYISILKEKRLVQN